MAVEAASTLAATGTAGAAGAAVPVRAGSSLDWQVLDNRPIPLGPRATTLEPGDLEEAAVEFEAYFLNVLMREMRKTLESDSLFSGDAGSNAGGYQALLDDALARHAARAGGIGLADQLIRQWEGR